MVDVGVQAPNDNVLAQDFVRFAVESGVLRFGEFKTKAGRMSPYFFNAGLFDDGSSWAVSQNSMQKPCWPAVSNSIFGPACRGFRWPPRWLWSCPPGASMCPCLQPQGKPRDHGEGGTLVGAPLKGRVLIVDDVMSAGTAAGVHRPIKAAGIHHHAVQPFALDRQEKATGAGWTWSTARCSTCATSWACGCVPLKLADAHCYLSKNGGQRCASITSGSCISPKYGVTEG